MSPLEVAKFWMQVEIDQNSKLLRTSSRWLGKCWNWTGSFFQSGYGRYFQNQKSFRAHRISHQICYGVENASFLVCHKCDNPACVNPQHLFLGTSKDNTQDMISKGRLNRSRGENKGVSFCKDRGKWRARYMRNYKSILVGEFDSKEDALKALHFSRNNPIC